MKIIFITREGYSLPGARIRCYNFSRELSRYGIEGRVLSFSDNLGAKDGAQEHELRIRDKIRLNFEAFNSLIKEKETFFCIQRFNYHSFAPYLAHLFNRNKRKLILDLDDWEIRENPIYHFGFFPSSKAHFLTRLISKRSVFCIAASKYLEDFLLSFNKNVYYIPSGVDTEVFRPSLNGYNKNKFIFSWIGTLHRREYVENIKFALDAFNALRKKYSHIYFEIAADGIYKNDLLKVTSRYADPNIIVKKWISPDSVPEYLATVHAGLFPVYKDTRFNRAKSPTKLFEYMAMEKATISSRIGEPSHIIQNNKNGFLADTENEFVERMENLIRNEALRNEMGREARETIENRYSLRVLGKRLYEIIQRYVS